jgi:hypothetical protein
LIWILKLVRCHGAICRSIPANSATVCTPHTPRELRPAQHETSPAYLIKAGPFTFSLLVVRCSGVIKGSASQWGPCLYSLLRSAGKSLSGHPLIEFILPSSDRFSVKFVYSEV